VTTTDDRTARIDTRADLIPTPRAIVTRLIAVDDVDLVPLRDGAPEPDPAKRGLLVEAVDTRDWDGMPFVEVTVWSPGGRMMTLTLDPTAPVSYIVVFGD
jgi:hypothetical protein